MPLKGTVDIAVETCKGCNLCVIHCPTKCLALDISDTNSYGLYYAILIDEEKCIACQNCAVVCPDAAIKVFKKVV